MTETPGNEEPLIKTHPNATSVPSLFRLTLTSATKRREPMRAEIPDQRHDRRYHDRRQKFELYHDM
jgi:hypothetical protein